MTAGEFLGALLLLMLAGFASCSACERTGQPCCELQTCAAGLRCAGGSWEPS